LKDLPQKWHNHPQKWQSFFKSHKSGNYFPRSTKVAQLPTKWQSFSRSTEFVTFTSALNLVYILKKTGIIRHLQWFSPFPLLFSSILDPNQHFVEAEAITTRSTDITIQC
jgi:hypothetical protein